MAIGDKFVGEIWVKPARSTSELENAGMVGTSLNISTADGENEGTSGPEIPSDWVRITTLFTAETARTHVTLAFRLQQTGNPANQGNVICVYLDDASLRPVP